MALDKETYTIGAIFVGVTCFGVGVSFGASILGPANNKSWIDFLTMLGGWVSGLGALGAVVAALKIADRKVKNEHEQDAVRCIHHALAIVNDLRGRLRLMNKMLTEGGRPVLALTKNAAAIERRYESLYDRDIYRHVPGDLIDLITSLSGSFFGLSVLFDRVATENGLKPHELLPPNTSGNRNIVAKTLSMLEGELDVLFIRFTEVRKGLVQ